MGPGMKKAIVAAGLVLALGAPQALAQVGSVRSRAGGDIIPDTALQLPEERGTVHNPEGEAEELRLAGKCDRAVPILRRLVDSPQSFPISKFNLGLCLLDLAPAEKGAAKAAGLRKEGAAWILRAANAGFGQAEARAVGLYLDGVGVPVDPVEAQKWALIYHGNAMRFTLNLPDVPQAQRDRLDSTLSDAQQDQAQARADAWQPKVQPLDR